MHGETVFLVEDDSSDKATSECWTDESVAEFEDAEHRHCPPLDSCIK